MRATRRRREEMVKSGGCCIPMYGRAGGEADAAWKAGRIMLRFRPIAPRPAAGAAAGSVISLEPYAPVKRPKRKGSAKRSGGSGRRGKANKVDATAASLSTSLKEDDKSSSSSLTSSSTIVTLPLIPETPERKDSPVESPPMKWWGDDEGAGVVVGAPRTGRKVVSWVTVECVTDAWREGEVAWRSDEGVKAALADDDCPGFVSDVWERVTWANDAYKRMVGASYSEVKGEQEEDAVTVELMTRGLVPSAWACRAFTCRVRVSYTLQPGRGNKSSPTLAAPCDAWRMDSGCCAWRLDIMAALTLSV